MNDDERKASSRNRSMAKCPECDADVSENARACPACGCPLGYPDFYIDVSNNGLKLEHLLTDYERKFHNSASALTAPSPLGCLFSRLADVHVTREQVLRIRDEIDGRLTQIHRKTEEYPELLLLKRFLMEVVLDACNARKANDDVANLPYAVKALEECLSRCRIEGDSEFIQMAITSCHNYSAPQAASNNPQSAVADSVQTQPPRANSADAPYPAFYINVSEFGLTLKNLAQDFQSRFANPLSALTAPSPFGSALSYPAVVPLKREDAPGILDDLNEKLGEMSPESAEYLKLKLLGQVWAMLLATSEQMRLIMDEIDSRLSQISHNSAEYSELKMLRSFVGKLLAVCNPRNRDAVNMALIIKQLEVECLTPSQIESDAEYVQEAIRACVAAQSVYGNVGPIQQTLGASANSARATQMPRNPMAVASFICSIVGLLCCPLVAIAGIVLGLVSLNQIKAKGGQQGGKNTAIAGIIVGAIGIPFSCIAWAVLQELSKTHF